MEIKEVLGKRYFMKMRSSKSLPFVGWKCTTSSDPIKLVECVAIETDDPDIVTLQPLDKGYGCRNFSLFYFPAYIRSGLIVEK